MRRRLFHLATLLSTALLLVTLGLWARGLGHCEKLTCIYLSSRGSDRAHLHEVTAAWSSWNLQFSWLQMPMDSVSAEIFLEVLRASDFGWTGLNVSFSGDAEMQYSSPIPQGFQVEAGALSTGVRGLFLGVRPWAPAALFAVLPLVWLYRRQRRRGWRFSLRESLVATAAVALLSCGFVLLKN